MMPLRFCGFCLVTSVKLEEVNCNHIEYLVGTIQLYSQMLACFECKAFIKKFNNFLHKFTIAQAALENILDKENQICEDDFKSINRKLFKLESSLGCCDKPLVISYDTEPDTSLTIVSTSSPETESVEPNDSHKIHRKVLNENCKNIEKELTEICNLQQKTNFSEISPIKEETTNIEDTNEETFFDDDDDDKSDASEERVLEDHSNKITEGKIKCSKQRDLQTRKDKSRQPSNKIQELDEFFTIVELTTSEQMEELLKRKESRNYKRCEYKCDKCYRAFKSSTTYRNHVKLTHDPRIGPVMCQICKAYFRNRDLNTHMKIHDRRYTCAKCGFVTVTRKVAIQHIRWHKQVVYECRICGEVFKNQATKYSHERKKHSSKSLCNICGLSFVSATGVQMHKKIVHFDHKLTSKEPDPKHYCQDCKVQFLSEPAWLNHFRSSSKHQNSSDVIYTCRHCGEKYSDLKSLRTHQLASHQLAGPKAQKTAHCSHCDLVFVSRKEHYKHHLELHYGRPYRSANFFCEMCGKGFQSEYVMRNHVKSKHENEKFECDYCKVKVSSKQQIIDHIKRHLTPNHLCTECGKVLSSKSSLRAHIKNYHGGARPFECSYCQKTFIRGSMLKAHVRDVHLGLAKKRVRHRETKRPKLTTKT